MATERGGGDGDVLLVGVLDDEILPAFLSLPVFSLTCCFLLHLLFKYDIYYCYNM